MNYKDHIGLQKHMSLSAKPLNPVDNDNNSLSSFDQIPNQQNQNE